MVKLSSTTFIQPSHESSKYLKADHLAHKICDILARYRITSPFDKFEKIGRPKIHAKVRTMVLSGQQIDMVLPAYPFKSPNSIRKVIGVYPDKADEFSLIHLNGLCQSIEEVYFAGARIIIVSDGLVYNDLLSVSDEDTWRYGMGIRKMAENLDLKYIEFVRVSQLMGEPVPQTEEQYVEQIGRTKARLLNEYLPEGYDFEKKIAEDPNALATYRGYLRFLALDLDEIMRGEEGKTAQKKAQSIIAKEMIKRGKCFANLIAEKFASNVRLSIHAADNTDKLAIALFPGSDFIKKPVTPWHNTPYQDGNVNLAVLHSENIPDKAKCEVILKEGKPWLLREINGVYEWEGMDLTFELLYPCGILVKPACKGQEYNFVEVDMQKVRHLALSNSPVVLRGFAMPIDKDIFRKKASELGEIQMWPFGDILEVRENADINMNNVLTQEDMPFHYDGCFKMAENDKGELVPRPPLFQMFRNKASTAVGGMTLFSSSKLLLELLPAELSLEKLSKLEWTSYTPANDAFGGRSIKLPLISPHPVTDVPTLRFHEPWPESKTAACQPTYVTILGVSKEESDDICEKLTTLLYDRRVCYRHQWEEGDILINDNMALHHTRTAYQNGYRELWRIHVDAAW
ncbi:uncharacterized protein VTP21DRAFT_4771 [Calcarisporiella thermophila]|uniref:uncharacterized protein n=1 Tax=Calcarisporiella thermophila TaxID=911321 RepID=UPI0037447EE9